MKHSNDISRALGESLTWLKVAEAFSAGFARYEQNKKLETAKKLLQDVLSEVNLETVEED